MALTTKAKVENYLLTSINVSFNTQIDEWIAAVGKEIDKLTDRQIIADDSDNVYYYSGAGKQELMIDDFFAITTIGVKSDKDDAAPEDITSDTYFHPVNNTPIYKLISENNIFVRGVQNIVVTGRRGYFDSAAIDDDIVFAATVLVAGIVNYSNTSSGEIKRESIGRYTVEYTTDQQKLDIDQAMAIIKSYRRIR